MVKINVVEILREFARQALISASTRTRARIRGFASPLTWDRCVSAGTLIGKDSSARLVSCRQD